MMNQSKRCFSVSELIVVIGIVFVASALLLPSYSRATSDAKGVTCISNLKAMNVAMSIYADDNDDVHLPAIRMYPQDPMQNWLYYLRNSSKLSNETLTCPDEADGYAFGKIPQNARPRMRFSYGMHFEAVIDNYTALHPSFTREQQRQHGQDPSDHIWVGDSAPDTMGKHSTIKNSLSALISPRGGYFDGTAVQEGSGWSPLSVRHGGKANLLMFDGHVESMSGKEMLANNLQHWKPMFYDWKWQDRK
ncbi:MAG: hypothetical protein J6S21_01610 [Victivallales bacterium]|nr:hypothetical protein [Victivallales bacterium]